MMSQIKFFVPGVPVPYVRTTQKQKYYDLRYKRYVQYSETVRWAYIQARSQLRSTFSGNAGQTSTTSQREYWTHLMALHIQTTGSVSNSLSGVSVKIIFKE